MSSRLTNAARTRLTCTAFPLLVLVCSSLAQQALDEESPWPRVRSANGHKMTLHLPQVERWTSNSFTARAAVELKLDKSKSEMLGVIWFDAQGRVNRSNRVVTLDHLEVTKARFPEAPDGGSNALAVVRELLPAGARTVSLDYLITALGFNQAAVRQAGALQHTVPEIIWATNRTVLVRIDGEPVLRPLTNSSLQRVVNTPALLIQDPASGRFYLSGDEQWFTAARIGGPWALAQQVPPEVAALAPRPAAKVESSSIVPEPAPRIIVSTSPAELLMTTELPDFRSIRGTALQFAADTDSQLFYHATERQAYLLISGRWFKAKSLNGPWNYVSPRDLPRDFARIKPGTPQGVILASVPDTPQADLALLANSVPTTATVSRHDAKLRLEYDGEPQFKPIEATEMSYAVNALLPVIRLGANYYALDEGVWFVAAAAKGPWEVAAEVPEEIYTIPPSSPVYYATFARVYNATEDEVEVGYTPGYTGSYENDGTVVYGTGYEYQPWYGNEYYGWGWSYGYGYTYVPWYQWWVWQPWWTPPGGLRAALIENMYDRWQGRPGVTPYGLAPRAPSAPSAPSAPGSPLAARVASAPGAPSALESGYMQRAPSAPSAPSAERGLSAGYPALYGRFRGSRDASELSPPANTVAFNPYLRPPESVRQGEVPHGAQLLTSVRQAPGGGRDLYASPDGQVYRRQSDGWYRRESGNRWSFYAPVQGRIDRAQQGAVSAAQATAPGVHRPVPAAKSPARITRPPDSGMRARGQEVAALERQYYARTIAQMRAQNWRPQAGVSRPVGRRR